MMTVQTSKWVLPVVMAAASFIISSYTAYTSNDKAITGRVVGLETQQANDSERLKRIENKLDDVIQEMRTNAIAAVNTAAEARIAAAKAETDAARARADAAKAREALKEEPAEPQNPQDPQDHRFPWPWRR